MKLLSLVAQNLRRNTKNFVFSAFGIVVGISTFIFFVALGEGIKTVVLEEIFVIRQLEVVPKSYDIGAFKTGGGLFGGPRLDDATADEIRAIDGVAGVYPKMKLMFPSRAWGGEELMGKNFYTELIADGLPPDVVQGDFEASSAFRDWDAAPIACTANDACPTGRTCEAGVCQGIACVPPKEDRRGAPTEDDTCPGESYCAPDTNKCEVPIPVIANPRALEIYNGSIHTAMKGAKGALSNMPQLSPNALEGFSFWATMGRSYLGKSKKGKPLRRRFKLVGFSPKAIGLGVTLPIGYVKRFNAIYRSDEDTKNYHALLVETDSNESVGRVATVVTDDMGFALDDKYENAQKAGLMITIITMIFSLISAIIICIAAINIMHTFLMLIVERRRELGIMRAVGATRAAIATLVLVEAAVVGFVGGALGCGLGVGATLLADHFFAEAVANFPFKPTTLFAWEPWFFAVGIGGAILFCVLGALLPAARAANTDPAAVLTGH